MIFTYTQSDWPADRHHISCAHPPAQHGRLDLHPTQPNLQPHAQDVRKLEQEIERDIERVERVIDTRIWGSSNKNKLDSLEQRLQSRPLNDPRPAVN